MFAGLGIIGNVKLMKKQIWIVISLAAKKFNSVLEKISICRT